MPEETPETPYILTVPLQIRVDREGGVPYVTLDKIRDYLTEAAIISWDQEGCGHIDNDGHYISAMQVDLEELQHGTVGKTVWKCQSCDNVSIDVDNFDFFFLPGTPWCPECGGPMQRTITNRIKCVSVEYDLNYHGGNYEETGEFAHVPFALVDEIKNPDGKAVMDDDKALELAFTKVTGYAPEHIVHYSFDEPVDQDGNEWIE